VAAVGSVGVEDAECDEERNVLVLEQWFLTFLKSGALLIMTKIWGA
jgi:hypothetical protein